MPREYKTTVLNSIIRWVEKKDDEESEEIEEIEEDGMWVCTVRFLVTTPNDGYVNDIFLSLINAALQLKRNMENKDIARNFVDALNPKSYKKFIRTADISLHSTDLEFEEPVEVQEEEEETESDSSETETETETDQEDEEEEDEEEDEEKDTPEEIVYAEDYELYEDEDNIEELIEEIVYNLEEDDEEEAEELSESEQDVTDAKTIKGKIKSQRTIYKDKVDVITCSNGQYECSFKLSDEDLLHLLDSEDGIPTNRVFGIEITPHVVKGNNDGISSGNGFIIPDSGYSRTAYTLVISDIDDTVKVSGIIDKATMAYLLLYQEHREVKGMSKLYQELYNDEVMKAEIQFASNSPVPLYTILKKFFYEYNFPISYIYLRPFKFGNAYIRNLKGDRKNKQRRVKEMIEKSTCSSVVLVGDSGEFDLEHYVELVQDQEEGMNMPTLVASDQESNLSNTYQPSSEEKNQDSNSEGSDSAIDSQQTSDENEASSQDTNGEENDSSYVSQQSSEENNDSGESPIISNYSEPDNHDDLMYELRQLRQKMLKDHERSLESDKQARDEDGERGTETYDEGSDLANESQDMSDVNDESGQDTNGEEFNLENDFEQLNEENNDSDQSFGNPNYNDIEHSYNVVRGDRNDMLCKPHGVPEPDAESKIEAIYIRDVFYAYLVTLLHLIGHPKFQDEEYFAAPKIKMVDIKGVEKASSLGIALFDQILGKFGLEGPRMATCTSNTNAAKGKSLKPKYDRKKKPKYNSLGDYYLPWKCIFWDKDRVDPYLVDIQWEVSEDPEIYKYQMDEILTDIIDCYVGNAKERIEEVTNALRDIYKINAYEDLDQNAEYVKYFKKIRLHKLRIVLMWQKFLHYRSKLDDDFECKLFIDGYDFDGTTYFKPYKGP